MTGSRIFSVVLLCVVAMSSPAVAQRPQSSTSGVSFVRTAIIKGGEMASVTGTDFDVAQGLSVVSHFPKPQLSGTVSPARVPADHVPVAAGNEIVSSTFFGFLGLTHRDQRLSGTGVYTNTQFNIEPPDQGLAVGSGFVVEPVNNVIAVYSATDGALKAGPEPLNQFFGLAPAIVRSTPLVFGPDLSDPRAYFDSDTGHFFITEVEIDRDPSTGALASVSQIFIAVSQTNDPTGSWNIFKLDVSNDGDSIFGACPCFGDQPLIGADKNGFYINGKKFSMHDDPMLRVRVGSMQHWRIVNSTSEVHPFHIHQIHFLAYAENGIQSDSPEWLDTVNVPYGGTVDLIMDFTDPIIRGVSLFHCHLLSHEDKGMMAKILFE